MDENRYKISMVERSNDGLTVEISVYDGVDDTVMIYKIYSHEFCNMLNLLEKPCKKYSKEWLRK